MIALALACLAAAVGVGFWSQSAYARMSLLCDGRRPRDLPRPIKREAGRLFLVSQGYGVLTLALALVAGQLL